jgi:predicted GIY-YIG superfamily endonuclease
MESFNIYALELADNKFYVGKTAQTVDARFLQHINGDGAEWTKLYKPIKILESYKTSDKYEEDKTTKKYMEQYGIENVRGGSYTKIVLEEWQFMSLEHELKGSNDLCYKCGKSGHFASECEEYTYKKYLDRFETINDIKKEITILEKDLLLADIFDLIIKKTKYIFNTNDEQMINNIIFSKNDINTNQLKLEFIFSFTNFRNQKDIDTNLQYDNILKAFEIKIDMLNNNKFITLDYCKRSLSEKIYNNLTLINNISYLKSLEDKFDINLNTFEELKSYNINENNVNAVINKIYLFRLQNKIEFNKLLKKYSKEDLKSFENDNYKKIELLLKKQIEFMSVN